MKCEKCQQEMIPINGHFKCLICGKEEKKEALNNEEKRENFDEKGKFAPGNKMGQGRPKGTLSIVKLIKDELENTEITGPDGKKITLAKALALKMIKKAIQDEEMVMMKDITDRTDGKPTERVEISQIEGINSNQENIFDEE